MPICRQMNSSHKLAQEKAKAEPFKVNDAPWNLSSFKVIVHFASTTRQKLDMRHIHNTASLTV
jgi:hypothetical protein